MTEREQQQLEIQRAVEQAYNAGYVDGMRVGHEKAVEEMAKYRRAESLGEDAARRILPETTHA